MNTTYFDGRYVSSPITYNPSLTLTCSNSLNVMSPFKTIEKDNKKIILYKALGFNESNIDVEKEFINKTKEVYVTVKGKFENDLIGWKDELSIKFSVDYNIYNNVKWNIEDGILRIILEEIENEEPKVKIQKI